MNPRVWLSVVMLLFVTACNVSSVPEGFDEDELKSSVHAIIEHLNEGQIDWVYQQFRTDVQALISEADFTQVILDKQAQVGDFKAYRTLLFNETDDPTNGERVAVVIQDVEHVSGRTTYTISFDRDGKIVGFFIR